VALPAIIAMGAPVFASNVVIPILNKKIWIHSNTKQKIWINSNTKQNILIYSNSNQNI
jgi:hypothetical protein